MKNTNKVYYCEYHNGNGLIGYMSFTFTMNEFIDLLVFATDRKFLPEIINLIDKIESKRSTSRLLMVTDLLKEKKLVKNILKNGGLFGVTTKDGAVAISLNSMDEAKTYTSIIKRGI